MSKLSPAAQAVWVAFKEAPMCAENKLVAALRAASDQVVPESREHHPTTFDEKHRKVSAFNVRNQLLAIADELEGAGND